MKSYLDTTILVNVLLKRDQIHLNSKNALKIIAVTELPVYAIKEFKRGALAYYIWLHNKFALTKSLSNTTKAIHSIFMQRHRQSTSLEAMANVESLIGKFSVDELNKKYGKSDNFDQFAADIYRLQLKRIIFLAWKNRRNISTNVINELSCYSELKPFIGQNNRIENSPEGCTLNEECCLSPIFKNTEALTKVLSAFDNMPNTSENIKRKNIIKDLIRKPKTKITESICRSFGDLYFSLSCPNDSFILTTNIKDHKPLASSLNKTAKTPEEVLS